jgi:hypothetical protein
MYCCRDINSLVEIVTGSSTPWGDCMVILEESMPSGLYVNPDQLSDMRRFGQVFKNMGLCLSRHPTFVPVVQMSWELIY